MRIFCYNHVIWFILLNSWPKDSLTMCNFHYMAKSMWTLMNKLLWQSCKHIIVKKVFVCCSITISCHWNQLSQICSSMMMPMYTKWAPWSNSLPRLEQKNLSGYSETWPHPHRTPLGWAGTPTVPQASSLSELTYALVPEWAYPHSHARTSSGKPSKKTARYYNCKGWTKSAMGCSTSTYRLWSGRCLHTSGHIV